jgi:hypothetical protein
MSANSRIEAARAAWSEIIEALRSETLVDARRLAAEITKDIEALFPRRALKLGHARREFMDITGERYGRLVAIKYVRRGDDYGRSVWLFQCDCGRTKEIKADYVRTGGTRSCGCLLRRRHDDIARDSTELDGLVQSADDQRRGG